MPQIAHRTTSSLAHQAQKAAAKVRNGAAKAITVKGKVKAAVDLMVHQGRERPEAAAAVGLTDHSLREALRKPHVLAYLNEQMEVLRTSGRPRALTRIMRLVDDAESERVQLDAAIYMDGMDRHASTVGAQVNVQVNNNVTVTPGYVIRLNRKQQIDHLPPHGAKPMDIHEDVPDDE